MRGIGRRRHHQDVRSRALLRQSQPLQHTETMLLVDDREAQFLELHVFFEQGVRADGDVHQAFREQLLKLRLLAVGKTAGQQHRDIAQLGEDVLEVKLCCVARISVGASTATW